MKLKENDRMFITIDGDSGSGKTTQIKLLVDRLQVKEIDIYSRFDAFYSISRFTGDPNGYAAMLACLQAVLHTPLSNAIIEHFWLSGFSTLFHSNYDDFAKAIRFFRMGMNLIGQKEPDLSILLNVPFEISEARRVHRYTHGNAIVTIPNKECQKPHNDRKIQLYRALESELPFFHIVDATGSVNDIANAIIELLPE